MLPTIGPSTGPNTAPMPHIDDGGGLQMLGKGREQDGLAERHDRRAERALRHAGQDQGLQAAGEAAQQRGRR